MGKKDTVMKGLGMAGKFAFKDDGSLDPRAHGVVQRLLSVQRPVVLAYIRTLRRRHPEASPQELAQIISKHYLLATTGGGAAVGATAAVPGIGTGLAVGVAAVETAGFLEGSALYAQALAELHGLPVRDPERANALVMGLMLGQSGSDLVRRFAGQARGTKNGSGDGADAITNQWGSLVAKQIPAQVLEALVSKLKKTMVRKFAAKGAGSVIGRILPFGVGAVIGGIVNHRMAKQVTEHARTAFGQFPTTFDPELDPTTASSESDHHLMGAVKNFTKLLRGRGVPIGKPDPEDETAPETVDGEVVGERPRTYRPDVRN
ncbi:hypothetical protein [Brevibacterium litoralis]|uniref:hypothetical protein n=1 Tax=Brevibacterium litoralis TaxID=3138935 RepID=UPI0032F06794